MRPETRSVRPRLSHAHARTPGRAAFSLFAALTVIVVFGCATPVGVRRAGESAAYRQINRSALNSARYSERTGAILRRYSLKDLFDDEPLIALQQLHAIASRDSRRDTLLALSELCFYLGERNHKARVGTDRIRAREFHLASAIYAYLYLLGPGEDPPPPSFDRFYRIACDLYNRSLARQLTEVKDWKPGAAENMMLPFGRVTLELRKYELAHAAGEYDRFLPADQYLIRGMSVRNRTGGLGAPMIAARRDATRGNLTVADSATLFLRASGDVRSLGAPGCKASLEIYSPLSTSQIEAEGQTIPLETDQTAALAYMLDNPFLWEMGGQLFRQGMSVLPPGIYPQQPYLQGRIPVVFVHGTMSSPVRWAEMVNTLRADPVIRQRCQVWLYLYDSGKPVVYSARHLRESLDAQIARCDPERKDPALRNMIIVGHSQGGLLTRLMVTETSQTLIQTLTGKSIDELDVTPKERDLLLRYGVFHPMPEVRSVVFMATPHRGSYLAGSVARGLTRHFLKLPGNVVQTGAELLRISARNDVPRRLMRGMPTSIDNMAPDHPALLALARLPFAPGVRAHSIIAIKGDEQPPKGNDGVVAYASAHLDQAASELVVASGHGCQNHPAAIEEVRRILLEVIAAQNASGPVVAD